MNELISDDKSFVNKSFYTLMLVFNNFDIISMVADLDHHPIDVPAGETTRGFASFSSVRISGYLDWI